MKGILVLLGAAVLLAAPAASAQTLSSADTARCCQSDKGPDPVAYSGRWLDGMYTRDKCLSVKYGFWDGDEPNEAKKVCAIRDTKVPEDPFPPPPEDTHK
ncbi:MAG: hypothetical protein ACT4OG_00255 [Alphaproteobacteria bacterium]